jgi:magnesium transporter
MLSHEHQFMFDITTGFVIRVDTEDAPIVAYSPPSEQDKANLVGQLLIDEHTLQSALDPDETARLEFEPAHVAVILKRPDTLLDIDEDGDFGVDSLGAFLFAERLVLVQSDDDPLFDHPRLGRCVSLPGALLQLFYQSIWQFMRNLKVIRQLSNSIQDNIAYSLGNQALSFMFALQKSLVYYQSALQSNHAVLLKLRINAVRLGFSQDELEFLEDLIVENDQCMKLVDIYARVLTEMSDARVSIVSNNLAVLMKKLTVISIVFMPLNIIAGMGGMSEWTMMTKGVPWPEAYSWFTVGLVVLGCITWLVIHNIGIEDRPRRRGLLARWFGRKHRLEVGSRKR